MSGYDETNPEAYRPTEPGSVADGGHSGVDSWSASSQADPATAVSGGEGPTAADNHGGYEDLSQAYAADASESEPVLPQGAGAQRWDETRQLPAEQSTSLYAQSAQEQYQQSQQQSYQQPQGQYSAPQAQPAAPSSYSSPQHSYQGQQSHFGSPYTSVPTTPGGYAPAGAPSGESFYTASKSAGTENGTTRRRGPGWFALVASVLVASLLGAGGAVGAVRYMDAHGGDTSSRPSTAPTAIATGSTTQTVNSTGQAPDWEAVSAAVSNAVVSIGVVTDKGTALGSGVIFDKEGHIITNNHVVAGASEIQVTLADGRVYDAEATGTDPATDLAVIQLKDVPDNLTVAQLGDSDKLATGQDVMAIGNPLGLSSTVTTGIISALDRPVVNSQNEDGSGGSASSAVYTNAIQIDAAINPGNSGGPLFDEKGRVIGITSSIATMGRSSSGEGGSGSIGIGFAIPVKLADKVAKQLIKSGTATHAYLGVTLDTAGATADGEKRAGAKITSVEGGSPADKAGLKKGDVVIAIDGKTTAQGSALTGYVRQYSANDKVKLTVIRDSKKQDIDVTLAERKDS
nr:trypsin-like peptidase domain-containing protein [Actinomyces oris]